MATHKLTLKHPHPISGFRNSLLGWLFSMPTALDALEGAIFTQQLGWTWQISPNSENPALQQMSLLKDVEGNSQSLRVLVNNGQWFTADLDTGYLRVIDKQVVADNYDVELWTPPPTPEPEPEPELLEQEPEQ